MSRRLLFSGIMLACALLATSGARASFTTSGRQVLRDGQVFQIRGVDYQPTPIGENPSIAQPFGDYYTTNYGALTARDLPLLRAFGANVIRVYGWDPAANHTTFLDSCYNNGVDPIFVLVNRWIDPATNWSSTTAVDTIRQEFLALDAGLANHPAVLGIVLGNETNAANGNGTNAAFWSAINSIAASIKQQNPTRLVSTAITDAVGQIAARDAAMTALDFWSVQVYRGTTFGTFFTQYAAASARPLVLTEFGLDAFNNVAGQPYPDNGAVPAAAIASLWGEIAANASVCAGGCVFQFSDEWWKSSVGSASTHDAGGFAFPSVPDGFLNEEWWGLYAVADNGALPDTLTSRAAVAALRALWVLATIAISAPPLSQTIAPGGAATLSVQAQSSDGGSLAYQWFKDGVAVPGAVSSSLVFPTLSAADSGLFVVRVTSGNVVATSESARLLVATPQPGQLINLSVRSRAGVGDATLIAGFSIAGGSLNVLVRGIGPGLAPFGVSGVLVDPRLTLFAGQSAIASNENWADNGAGASLATTFSSVSAFLLDPASRDSAIVSTVSGAHSVHVTGADGGSGVALAEIYEVISGAGRLVNVSARTNVGTGDDVLIVGFVISGNVPRRILVRGIGPGLAPFGVGGVLADPLLQIFDASGALVASNDDWSAGVGVDALVSAAQASSAFPLATGSKDAALVRTLVPGLFTAQVSGVNNTSGIALVEIYEVP